MPQPDDTMNEHVEPADSSEPATETLPPAYPGRWDADVVLADGSTVQVRPIRPDDGLRILAFHERQSPESIYFRYFSPHPQLTGREIEHLTRVDYEDRMAFVALRDDVLVAVARYDRWPTRAEAEVAFFIDDSYQGKGLATLLLEYLAAAARSVGIRAFTATVLPSNRRMVSVFRNAGFSTSSSFEDGLIEVHLDLQPTPEAEAAIEERARNAEARAVELLLKPRSVAVIGASRQRGSVGHEVLRNLLRHELAGPVYPVNPAARHVAGVRVVPSIEEVDDTVDLAVVTVPAAEVPPVIEACGRCGVRAVIVLSAGFAEAGDEGAALSAQALRAARRFGIRLLGPNCLGVINTDPEVRLHATFATPNPRPGNVALLSESGTIGGVIVDRMRQVGLGISSFAAIGNRADVSANDLLRFWQDDPRTEIVLLYLESFGNPRKFSRLARHLARTKPVVAVKSGQTAHAYPDEDTDLPPETIDALLRQTGIIRVDTLSQSLDVARVLAGAPQLPQGPRVAVVGNAGGSLVAAADACVDAGLEMAAISGEAATGHSSWPTKLRDNPLDLGFQAQPDDLRWVLSRLLDDDEVDSALVICAPSHPAQVPELTDAISRAHEVAPGKPVVACILGDHPPTISPQTPVFDFPDAAAYALGRVTQYALWRQQPEGRLVEPEGASSGFAQAAASDALVTAGEGWLPMATVAEVLRTVGLEPVPTAEVGSVDEAVAAAAELGYPVAVKARSRHRLAKSELGGLALDVQGDDDLRATCERIVAALGDRAFPLVVQPMALPGVDAAVGVTHNPLVGPVLWLGAGGVASPVAARTVQALPLSDVDAARCVADSDLGRLLGPAEQSHLEDLLLRLATLVEAGREVAEVELDPVIVRSDGTVITDARLRVAAIDLNPLPPVRRL